MATYDQPQTPTWTNALCRKMTSDYNDRFYFV